LIFRQRRVPAVYLDPPNLPILAFLAFWEINNLPVINRAYGFESHPRLQFSRFLYRADASFERERLGGDFNQTICVPGKEFPGILQNKKLQMEDEWRVKFKIKLATCLARLTNEERAADLIDPWIGKQKDIEFPPAS
jgi:hypothetical protein